MGDHVKINFEIPIEGSEECEVESLWALPCGNGYKLDNIPFYAKGVSFGDVVTVEKIGDCLHMVELAESSGHSTVRLWFADIADVQVTRKTLESFGCSSEISDQPRLVAVDISPSVTYDNIRAYLDEGEINGKWDYEEACLGFL
ncbi:MAG: hypothetical protein COB29_14750 [Sulfitobacter sp.]|nr:MAG: hypothetical protein COB29_14750 [Sulfitobacter sp.]